jgi:putative mRNA 3-end processing factor
MNHLNPVAPILLHGAVWKMCEALSMPVAAFQRIEGASYLAPTIVVAPPSVANASSWLKKFEPYRVAALSGWMAISGIRRRRAVDAGFVLSDHADFYGLTEAIKATGAERVLLTHGYSKPFARWLTEQGIQAQELRTSFGEEDEQGETQMEEA